MDINIARDRISYVVKPDSITASQGDFLATHVAINRLHLLNKFDILPSGGKNYSEEEVFDQYVLNPNNQHQFIAVYGQSGTGKSHLIRWFEAKFEQVKPDNEVVLFIRRSDNTLKGTIRQLLEKPEVKGIANREIYERLVKASVFVDENKLKDMIYHNFIIELHNDDDSHPIKITNVKRKRLEAFLNNEVVHDHLMSEKGPIERMYSKIAEHTLVDRDTIAQFLPEDFYVSADLFEDIHRAGADPKAEKMAREFMADESGAESASVLASYLNQFVNDVIQRCAGIEPGDFRQIFQDIRKELYRLEKNLTLFIEDVTSFTGVDDALLDALIVEHTGMNAADNLCRISSIVGTTSNYLQNNFRDNHKDRITQYVYIPSDVFDDNELFEFVGRYVNTMSLTEDVVNAWLNNHANPADYPVHEVKQGSKWEYVSIGFGKKLCLYPFTKNSIKYLYNYGLTKGHQTPRYIIRDIIEPVVNDIINNSENFPSVKYNLVNVNTTLSYGIHNQIKDDALADRLLRILCIWGNGQPEQYSKKDITYISGVPESILTELGLPTLKFSEVKEPDPNRDANHPADEQDNPEVTTDVSTVPVAVQERVSKANAILTEWSNGKEIDYSATGGVTGLIRKAVLEDMCSFLFSTINWQVEGISDDNINKVKSSKKLLCLERQTKGSGFYQMPASWESMNVISAFIRWREFGNQSWNYPDSDLDAFLVTSWASKIKDSVVKAVSDRVEEAKTPYIEAAIAAEMYRLILCGEFREHSLKNLSTKYLFESTTSNKTNNCHSREWNGLVSLITRNGADSRNKETIRQYFNITQGSGSTVVVLDEPELSKTVRRVKNNRLEVAEETMQLQDPVKLRRDVFNYLKDISDRIKDVSRAEVDKARDVIQIIYDHFDSDEIEEDDIVDLVDTAKSFYGEINSTQINIAVASTDAVKKGVKQIAKAINDVGQILPEDDVLNILMTFAGDPISTMQPLIDLLKTLDGDVEKLDQRIAVRKNALGIVGENLGTDNQYRSESESIESDLSIVASLR